jgi:hypothetical protein
VGLLLLVAVQKGQLEHPMFSVWIERFGIYGEEKIIKKKVDIKRVMIFVPKRYPQHDGCCSVCAEKIV